MRDHQLAKQSDEKINGVVTHLNYHTLGGSHDLCYNSSMPNKKSKPAKPAKKQASKPIGSRFVGKDSDVIIRPPKKKN
jgi:hypothetical protein